MVCCAEHYHHLSKSCDLALNTTGLLGPSSFWLPLILKTEAPEIQLQTWIKKKKTTNNKHPDIGSISTHATCGKTNRDSLHVAFQLVHGTLVQVATEEGKQVGGQEQRLHQGAVGQLFSHLEDDVCPVKQNVY